MPGQSLYTLALLLGSYNLNMLDIRCPHQQRSQNLTQKSMSVCQSFPFCLQTAKTTYVGVACEARVLFLIISRRITWYDTKRYDYIIMHKFNSIHIAICTAASVWIQLVTFILNPKVVSSTTQGLLQTWPRPPLGQYHWPLWVFEVVPLKTWWEPIAIIMVQ